MNQTKSKSTQPKLTTRWATLYCPKVPKVSDPQRITVYDLPIIRADASGTNESSLDRADFGDRDGDFSIAVDDDVATPPYNSSKISSAIVFFLAAAAAAASAAMALASGLRATAATSS